MTSFLRGDLALGKADLSEREKFPGRDTDWRLQEETIFSMSKIGVLVLRRISERNATVSVIYFGHPVSLHPNTPSYPSRFLDQTNLCSFSMTSVLSGLPFTYFNSIPQNPNPRIY